MKYINGRKMLWIYVVLSIFIFGFSIYYNRDYFNKIVYDNIFLYQAKQVLSVLIFWVIGFSFLKIIEVSLNNIWICLFSFSIGMSIWVLAGYTMLLLNIPFQLEIVLIIIVIIIIALYIIRRKIYDKPLVKQNYSNLFLLIFGTALLVSTGFIYVVLSYDSLYYFINYGKALVSAGDFASLASANSYVLTNIGQYLPIVNCLPAFLGIDQSYSIQAFLTINLSATFGYAIYEKTKNKKLTVLVTLLLVTSTTYIFSTAWILANMYCMVFLFFLFYIGLKDNLENKIDLQVIMALLLFALTMLRKDGILYACFALVCIATKDQLKCLTMYKILLPSIIVEIWWLFYVRVILDAQVQLSAGTSIANNENILYIIGIICATCIYLKIRERIFKRNANFEKYIMMSGLILINAIPLMISVLMQMNVLPFAIRIGRGIDNVDTTIKNLFRLPSSSGVSAYFIVIMMCIMFGCTKIKRKPVISYEFLYIFGYILLTFASYNLTKRLWVNIDDSFYRVLQQIFPVMVYWICIETAILFKMDKEDNKCLKKPS